MTDKPNDGGPAFPRTPYPDNEAGRNGAFTCFAQDGMSLHDWFAGQAGKEALDLLNQYFGSDWMGASIQDAINELTKTKRAIADAMLAEREKER